MKRFDLNRAEQMWQAAHSPQNVTYSDVAAMIDSQYSCFDEDTYEKLTYADAMRDVALARERSFESAVPVDVSQSESASMPEGASQFEDASEVQWREDRSGSLVRVSPVIQRDPMGSDISYVPLPRSYTKCRIYICSSWTCSSIEARKCSFGSMA